MRVFPDALDRDWRVRMSKAILAGIARCATGCELPFGNRRIHTSKSFVPSLKSPGALSLFGSGFRRFRTGPAPRNEAFGHINAPARCGNAQRAEFHSSAGSGRRLKLRSGQVGDRPAVKLWCCAESRTSMKDRETQSEFRCADAGRAFSANSIPCLPDDYRRGLKPCR